MPKPVNFYQVYCVEDNKVLCLAETEEEAEQFTDLANQSGLVFDWRPHVNQIADSD